MRVALLAIFIGAFSYKAQAQEISGADLSKTNGTWFGYLIYTDYSDDQKQVKLETNLRVDWKNNRGSLLFEYTEPNGKIVRGKQKMRLGQSKDEFFMDGDWSIIDFKKSKTDWKLTLEKSGKDNNRTAEIRQELQVSPSSLTIEKLVKYQGTEQFFTRNKYEFQKNTDRSE